MIKSFLFLSEKTQISSNALGKFAGLLIGIFILFLGSPKAQNFPSRNFTTAEGLPNNAVHALHLDSRGILWIGTENGVSKMENGQFQNFYEEQGLAFNSCWAIGEDSEGKLWFGSYGGGLTIFDGRDFQTITTNDGLTDNRIRHFYPYKEWMLVGTEDGITLIHTQTKEVIPVESSIRNNDLNLTTGFLEKDGKIYFSTYRSGFYELYWESNIPKTRLLNDWLPIYSFHLTGNNIQLADKGILHEIDFNDFIVGKSPTKTFGQSIVWKTIPFAESKNLMSASGLFTKTGGVFLSEGDQWTDLTERMGISSRFILTAAFDPNLKTLFLGSQDKGLFEVNMAESITYFPMDRQEVKGFAGNEQTLGILSGHGLEIKTDNPFAQVVNRENFKRTQAEFFNNFPNRIPLHMDGFYELDPQIPADEIDFYEIHWQNQHFWINTNIGIYQIDVRGKITAYLPIHCYSMGFTPDGKLLETSPFAGVRIYSDPAAMQFEYFPPDQSTTPIQVVKVEQGEKDSFLASVFFGLYKWDGKKFHSYLNSGEWDEVKLKALHRMESGELLVGTEFGEVFLIASDPAFRIVKKWESNQIQGNSILFLESFGEAILIGTELGIQVIVGESSRFFDEEQGILESITLGAKRVGNNLFLGTSKGYYQINIPKIFEEIPSEIDLTISELKVNHQPIPADQFLWFRYIGGPLNLASDENTLQVRFLPEGNLYPKKLQYRYRLKKNAEWSDFTEETNLELPLLPSGSYELEVEVLDYHSGRKKIVSLLTFQIDSPIYYKGWFILLLVGILAGLFFFIYRVQTKDFQLKTSLKQRLAETKLEALRSQMNPHFIFNAINSVQYFILKNDTEKGLEFLARFSSLIRMTLDYSSKTSITLQEEIEYLTKYISIENTRMDERVDWKIEGNALTKATQIQISPMLIQPLVENVFVHAFPNDHPNPTLRLTFSITKDCKLICNVSDNGSGLDAEKELQNSKGINLIRDRIALLGSNPEEILILNSQTGTGTEVTLTLPIHWSKALFN